MKNKIKSAKCEMSIPNMPKIFSKYKPIKSNYNDNNMGYKSTKTKRKYTSTKNLPVPRFVSAMALSKVNVDSRTKRLLLLRVQATASSNLLSMYALASRPQATISDSKHLQIRSTAQSVAISYV